MTHAPLSSATRLRQNPRVACRVYDGCAEVITLDEPIRQHRLNPVGTLIWSLAEGGVTVEELSQKVAAEFAVDAATAEQDALDFCADLVARGMFVTDGSVQ